MPEAGIVRETIDHIERSTGSQFEDIQHEHGGEFIALLKSKGYVLKDDYLELIDDLKDRDVELSTVNIANIPKKR